MHPFWAFVIRNGRRFHSSASLAFPASRRLNSGLPQLDGRALTYLLQGGHIPLNLSQDIDRAVRARLLTEADGGGAKEDAEGFTNRPVGDGAHFYFFTRVWLLRRGDGDLEVDLLTPNVSLTLNRQRASQILGGGGVGQLGLVGLIVHGDYELLYGRSFRFDGMVCHHHTLRPLVVTINQTYLSE